MAVSIHSHRIKVVTMSNDTANGNINSPLFTNPTRAIMTRTEKEGLREQLNRDVEAWLAAGNTIDDRGVAKDRRDDRRMRVHVQGQFT